MALYGPSTKQGAIVGGQTSCKTPEVAAFERHLPPDVEIITCHSMHGPKVDPKDQPLAIIKHRASDRSLILVKKILGCFDSQEVELTAAEHDTITADTQAVTHAAFLSMGTAWKANNQFPWVIPRYVGGIENVKANLMLRIYSNKWHVYAGLALLNPSAKLQVTQYAASATALFNLMIGGHRTELEIRIKEAGKAVFGDRERKDMLLKDEILDRFSLGKISSQRMPNNHLSLLAMVDCWWKLGIVPYKHLICSTPVSLAPLLIIGFSHKIVNLNQIHDVSRLSKLSNSLDKALLTHPLLPPSSSAFGLASQNTFFSTRPSSPKSSTPPSQT